MKIEELKFKLWFVVEMIENIHRTFTGSELDIRNLKFYENQRMELEAAIYGN